MSAKHQGLSLLFPTILVFIFSLQTLGAYPDYCDSEPPVAQIDLNVGDTINTNLVLIKLQLFTNNEIAKLCSIL